MNFNFHTFLIPAFLLAFVFACDSPGAKNSEKPQPPKKGQLKDGLIVTKNPDGSVSTRVNYKQGRKDGLSTSYYDNGNVQLEMTYKDGKREGISKKYYESGKLYAETPYKNGKINGLRRTYYSDGKIKAETPYENNLIGTGTKIYTTQGAEMPEYQLIVKKTGERTYDLSTNPSCKKTTFYEGALTNGQFLDESEVMATAMYGNKGVFTLKDNKNVLSFSCKCITSGNNTLILNKKIKVQ